MRFIVLLLAIWTVPVLGAQDSASPNALHLTGSVKTALTGAVFNRAACDEAGNFYLRQVPDSGSAALIGRQPLLKIRPDGTLANAFKIADVSPDMTVQDFFVGSESDVYMVASSSARSDATNPIYVARFAGNGSLRATTQIASEEKFTPALMAVFKSGEILLSGVQGKRHHIPFTGVFSPSGKLIRKIFEPEDEDLRQRAEAGDQRVLSVSAGGGGNAAAELGSAVLASDGNVYVMRATAPVLIYAISPVGDVVRKLHIDTGDQSLVGDGLQSAPGGRLAVSLSPRAGGGTSVAIIDLKGNPVAMYDMAPGVPFGTFGCYAPPKLTFLSLDKPDDPLYLNALEPK